MTNEELVYLYQQGDKHALQGLIEKNNGIINKLVNKFYIERTNSIDREDLEQEGVIGLIIAANKYDFNNDKKAKFVTYAVHWIYSKIGRYIRQKNTNDETSLNMPVGDDGYNEIIDIIKDEDYSYENIEEKIYRQQLRQELEAVMLKHNNLKEREILKLHYGWDNSIPSTYEEIAQILDTTRNKIRSKEQIAIRKLRDSMWARKKYNEIYAAEKLKRQIESYDSIQKRIEFLDFLEEDKELEQWCNEQLKRKGLSVDTLIDYVESQRLI